MVCLDTDFLIGVLRGDSDAINKLKELIIANEEIATTSINLAELFKGAYMSKHTENIKLIERLSNSLKIFEFDKEASKTYGELYYHLKKKGRQIGEVDLLIASILLSKQEIIITRNIKHFSKIKKLKIETW